MCVWFQCEGLYEKFQCEELYEKFQIRGVCCMRSSSVRGCMRNSKLGVYVV